MVPIGYRPILWHVMKYYAHFGHKDFILCLGYQADVDQGLLPQLRRGAVQRLRALRRRRQTSSCSSSDIDDWRITFVDTGLHANIGERLLRGARRTSRARRSSWPTTATASPTSPLPTLIDDFRRRDEVAHASCRVRPTLHASTSCDVDDDGRRHRHRATSTTPDLWINGGYFVFRREIFDYIAPGRGAGRASRSSG